MTNEVIASAGKVFMDYVSRGLEFAEGQIPDVINQVLAYERVENCIGFVCLLILTILSLFAIKYFYKMIGKDKDPYYENDGCIILMTISMGLFVICLGSSFVWASCVIKSFFMPKVYLMEYFVNMFGSM